MTTDVLIVGAGPTGLMMACQLAINKIPFRIIDKNEDHTMQSRALVIQARSVEILDRMGVAEKAVGRGKIANAIGAFFNGKKVLRVTVSNLGQGLTKFPYLLMLEQSLTEAILVDFLKGRGLQVERKTELKSFTQNKDEVICVLELPDGMQEVLNAKYIIGADGAHSIVREQLKIPFGGRTYQESLFVLDCKADVNIPNDEMYLTFADKAIGGFFPLTNGRWRVLGNIPKELEDIEEIKFEDVERHFAERVHMNVKLYDPHWISVYRSHHRYAATFQKHRCFLTGDAAHIHSPVGAQGMNTGLQDAYNLGWKLAFVLKGKARENLLDTYTEERISIARKLVRTTDRAFNIVTNQDFFIKNFRFLLMPLMLRMVAPIFQRVRFIQRLAFKMISEIGINYRKNSLARDASSGKFPGNAPKPGDRLPFIQFKDAAGVERNIQDNTKPDRFCLFVFGNNVPKEFAFIERFEEMLSVEVIPLLEQTKILYKKFGIKKSGYYLVRPDMYIAFRADHFGTKQLTEYLSQFMAWDKPD